MQHTILIWLRLLFFGTSLKEEPTVCTTAQLQAFAQFPSNGIPYTHNAMNCMTKWKIDNFLLYWIFTCGHTVALLVEKLFPKKPAYWALFKLTHDYWKLQFETEVQMNICVSQLLPSSSTMIIDFLFSKAC